MIKQLKLIGIFSMAAGLCTVAIEAQPGPQYEANQTTISSGGGVVSNSESTVTSTIAQPIAGTTSSGGVYAVQGGFWWAAKPPTDGAPLSGRVLSSDGRGLRDVTVTITDPRGVSKRVITGAFGNYRFVVRSGAKYVINVVSKRYRFESRTLGAADKLTDVDLIARE